MDFGGLLTPPTEDELRSVLESALPEDVQTAPRSKCAFEPLWQKFVVRGRQFDQQFCHVYARRFAQLREAIWAAARRQWADQLAGEVLEVERIVQLREDAPSVCVGVLYKQMRLRHSVIEEYQKELGISETMYPLDDYTSSEDTLEIEDDSGRMRLTGDVGSLPVHALSTGLAVALLGKMTEDGEFHVEAWCTPGMPEPLPEASLSLKDNSESGPFVLITSGLSFGGNSDPLPASLLVDYVAGRLGSTQDRVNIGSNICRVILAGNSMAPLDEGERLRDRNLPAADQERIAGPLYELDSMLAQVGRRVPDIECKPLRRPQLTVDLMPGAEDASSISLPQQPFHRSLLPTACRYPSLMRPPNPYEALVENRHFIGTSGQPVDDLLKFTKTKVPEDADAKAVGVSETEESVSEVLDVMERMLSWRHLAPTAPDTLPCYPFYQEDPFVLENTPQVFFAGNQRDFGCRRVRAPNGGSCLLISVPKFSATGDAVLVNLSNLEASRLHFGVSMTME
eukprot:scaffold1187_cov258-Pinguiococcus_pyrenoidosus.AAC.18